MVGEGDDVARLVGDAIERTGITPADFDVVVVTQKIVSKAEGRGVQLGGVQPSSRAIELAATLDKDPRMVELVLRESNSIVAYGHGVLITEHRNGHVMANAGVDRSNVGQSSDGEEVLLLPLDADASAMKLHHALEARFRCRLGVVISDSAGRAWRHGVTGLALGSAGLPSLIDLRGAPDLFGKPLEVTLAGFGDQIASAANLVAGEAGEGMPAVHVRGLAWSDAPAPARTLVRERDRDLFR